MMSIEGGKKGEGVRESSDQTQIPTRSSESDLPTDVLKESSPKALSGTQYSEEQQRLFLQAIADDLLEGGYTPTLAIGMGPDGIVHEFTGPELRAPKVSSDKSD